MLGNLQGHEEFGISPGLKFVETARAHANGLRELLQAFSCCFPDGFKVAVDVRLIFSGHSIAVSFWLSRGS